MTPGAFPSSTASSVADASARRTIIAWKASLVQMHLREGEGPAENLRTENVAGLGQLLAAAGPDMEEADLETLADLHSTVLAIAERYETVAFHPRGSIDLLTCRLTACATGAVDTRYDADPIARCLRLVAKRLWEEPLGRALWAVWNARVAEMLRAMIPAIQPIKAVEANDALDAYLEASRHRSGVPLVALAAWILLKDSQLIQNLDGLEAAARHFAIASCLASDLRGGDKEQADRLRLRLSNELAAAHKTLAAIGEGTEESTAWLSRFASVLIRD